VVVVGAEESVDAAHKSAVARLRAAGEQREIVFPKYETDERGELREAITAIITGVPRAGREPENYMPPPSVEPPAPSIMSRRTPPPVSEPQPAARNAATTDKQITEAPPSGREAQMHRIWTQTEQPSQANPGGSIIEGRYVVIAGMLEVWDMADRLLGHAPVSPGDNVEAIARRILREKTCADFYRPLYH
jgi:hypothetical protein